MNILANVIFSCALMASVQIAHAAQNGNTLRPSQEQTLRADIKISQTASGFQVWIKTFRPRALAQGISATTYDRAFRGVKLNARVIAADRKQSEFTKTIWDYLDTATSPKRVSNGKDAAFRYRRKLLALEKRYQVDARAILAIWGLESAYGTHMGDIRIIEALATLAYEGRRRKFGEQQLIAALKILQSGDTSPGKMLGSWAGAMGHTQFIPTSYLAYAQDFNGDGRRDIWNPHDPMDALASTAHYLHRFGWELARPWGMEVRLPIGFNFSKADIRIKKPVSYWRDLGVRLADGRKLPNHGSAAILAPAGARGPVFVIFKNFYVIKRYNNANAYALAVGHLGDKIFGGDDFKATWPRGEKALSFSQKQEMQRLLTRRGFDTGGADGVVGPVTIGAIRSFQASIGIVPDGFASTDLLKHLKRGQRTKSEP